MSNKNNRLGKLLKIRRIQERQSMQALARAQADTDAARERADELQQLAADYKTRHLNTPQMSPAVLSQFREFYGQLAHAKAVQAGQVTQAERAQETVRQHLLGHIKQRQGLEKVVTKRDQAHRTRLQRKERRALSSIGKSMV